MSEENFRIKVENYIVTHDEKITELVQKLSEVSIKASAKAVIVPEGKGIFWTDKIEALEKNWNLHIQSESRIHDDQRKQFSELRTLQKEAYDKGWFWNLKYSVDRQISELRKDLHTVLQARNWNSEVIYDNKEVLRELFYALELYIKGKSNKRKIVFDLRVLKEKLDVKSSACSKCSLESGCIYSFEKDPIKNKDYFKGCHDFQAKEGEKEGFKIINPQPWDSKELEETATISEIIEIYDNGHENIFNPEEYKLVRKEDLRDWNGKVWDAVENEEFDIEVFEKIGKKIEIYLSEEEPMTEKERKTKKGKNNHEF